MDSANSMQGAKKDELAYHPQQIVATAVPRPSSPERLSPAPEKPFSVENPQPDRKRTSRAPRVFEVAGRSYRLSSAALPFRATAYDADYACTGKNPADPAYGITASGAAAKTGWTVAVDPKLVPLGTLLYIEDMGIRRAEDTGSNIKGSRLDVFVATHEEALRFGVKELWVWTLEEVSPRMAATLNDRPASTSSTDSAGFSSF